MDASSSKLRRQFDAAVAVIQNLPKNGKLETFIRNCKLTKLCNMMFLYVCNPRANDLQMLFVCCYDVV